MKSEAVDGIAFLVPAPFLGTLPKSSVRTGCVGTFAQQLQCAFRRARGPSGPDGASRERLTVDASEDMTLRCPQASDVIGVVCCISVQLSSGQLRSKSRNATHTSPHFAQSRKVSWGSSGAHPPSVQCR